MRIWIFLSVLAGLPSSSWAGNYFLQSTFNIPPAMVKGIDSDGAGNLYLLGQTSAGGTFSVMSYQTPGMAAALSFGTAVSTAVAFAVETNGIVDILDAAGGVILRRFSNTGNSAGQANFGYSLNPGFRLSAAIDKTRQRVYLSQYYPSLICALGGSCGPPVGTTGIINQYDFSGTLLRQITMPGNSSTSGCFTPSMLTADTQGNIYIADGRCQQILQYSAAGTLLYQLAAPISFPPSSMWTDMNQELYLSGLICGVTACAQGVTRLTSAGVLDTSFIANATIGTAWDGRILYVNSMSGGLIQRFIFSNPPSVPSESAPMGMTVQHSSAASLSWQAAYDADGDPVTYSVYLGQAPNQLSLAGTASLPAFTTQPLVFGATYYWQTAAQASYQGIPLQNVSAPVVSFNLSLLNHPPNAFGVIAGTGTWVTRNTTVVMGWQPAVDPDSDPVAYDVLWQSAGQAAPVLAGTTTQTSWPMMGLAFGTTYYWSIRARDVYNAASTTSVQSTLLMFQNNPPNPIIYASSAGIVGRVTSSTLSWQNTGDSDGDSVVYSLYLSTNPAAQYIVQQGSSTTYALDFQFGTTYYWNVVATDIFGAQTSGTTQAFFPVFLNEPPGPLSLAAPFQASPIISTMRDAVSVSWHPVTTPQGDPITYTVYLGNTPSSLNILTRIIQASAAEGLRIEALPNAVRPQSAVQANGDLINLTLSGLDYYRTYYFLVTASNPYGASSATSLETFTLNAAAGFPKAYNYPNPFNPNQGGTNIVFNAPASGYAKATISIYSETQELLFRQDYSNIAPGISQVPFSGRDRSGKPLFNGSYPCRVRFEGPSDQETFPMMVVK